MSRDLQKLSEAFRLMADVAFPAGYLAQLELAAVTAHLEATRAQRAAHLLATRGPDEAAALMGVSRCHIYRLAEQARKVSKCDDFETDAA